jgi:hypothetical protein
MPPHKKRPAQAPSQLSKERRRFSITLSNETTQTFEWLKEVTDADTDSEVIRNSLRLQANLLKAHQQGATFYIQEGKNDEPRKIDLFFGKF